MMRAERRPPRSSQSSAHSGIQQDKSAGSAHVRTLVLSGVPASAFAVRCVPRLLCVPLARCAVLCCVVVRTSCCCMCSCMAAVMALFCGLSASFDRLRRLSSS